jgi:metal-responsive CopG/Arc/MetJ family transcriptional regulator
MKRRISITIDESLVQKTKQLAKRRNISLSSLVEESIRKIVAKHMPRKINALEVLKTMSKPEANTEAYSKNTYLEERKGRFGH